MDPGAARIELQRLLYQAPDPFPLDRAALLLAVDEYPDLDLALYEAQLDGYAMQVRDRLGQAPPEEPRLRLTALRRVLFEDEGFHGNREQYYDVRNSYLNEVLDRKLGIPISLATVVLGVARRLAWPMHGVSFPAHFLVRYAAERDPLAIDAFHGGLILGTDELEERWRLNTGHPAPPVEQMLRPASSRNILLRMLNNIRLVHTNRGDYQLADHAVEKMLLIDPNSA